MAPSPPESERNINFLRNRGIFFSFFIKEDTNVIQNTKKNSPPPLPKVPVSVTGQPGRS
jgi:hypothetical protein